MEKSLHFLNSPPAPTGDPKGKDGDRRTLLERAKASPSRRGSGGYGKEDYELALALLTGEITPGQAEAAWGITAGGSGSYARAFNALRAAYRAGLRFHWEKEPE